MSQASARMSVVIETARYQIVGDVDVPDGMRLSDYANDSERTFFALTSVRIAPLDQPDRERSAEFMLVNRREVSVMLPEWAPQKVDRTAAVFDDFMNTQND